jgi:hypothetical protein
MDMGTGHELCGYRDRILLNHRNDESDWRIMSVIGTNVHIASTALKQNNCVSANYGDNNSEKIVLRLTLKNKPLTVESVNFSKSWES